MTDFEITAKESLVWLMICTFVVFIMTASIVFLWQAAFLLTGILVLVCLPLFLVEKKDGRILFIAAAIFGPLFEAFILNVGMEKFAWQFTNPQWLGIPTWLPFMWGILALFGKSAYIFIQTILHRTK